MNRAAGIGLLIALGYSGWACGETTKAPQHPNVLLIVVDTLRQDHLGAYGFDTYPATPALDAFAAEATLWDGLTCVSSWTMPSMATIWTGLEPSQHGVMRMVGPRSRLKETQTLAQQFRQAGYTTACVMGNFLLRKDRGVGFHRGFEHWDDSVTDGKDPHHGSTADLIAERAQAYIEEFAEGGKPWFLVLHFFDPHGSYEDQADWNFTSSDYQGWVKGGLKNADYMRHQEFSTTADLSQLGALYAEEVAVVDRAFGRVVKHLRSTGQWNSTSVVFTADHGEELGEAGHIGHTKNLSPATIALPLLIKDVLGAWEPGRKVTALVPQSRLFSTLLELGNIPLVPNRPAPLSWKEAKSEPCFVQVDFEPIRPDPAKRIQKHGLFLPEGRWIKDLKRDQLLWLPVIEGAPSPIEPDSLLEKHAWWKP
jgi:arylsulfatase A-like enzyme